MGGLRIVAGRLRGRRIARPAGSTVRPTPERVREALFNILGERVVGARLLDAFAGTGALGFEALSRGAERVVFVEADRRVAARLRDSAASLGLGDAAEVIEARLPAMPRPVHAGAPYDVILVDPPYAVTGPEADAILAVLSGMLAPGGTLVWERAARSAGPCAAGLGPPESRRYGNTALDLFASPAAPGTRS